ncbi:MAG: hypothetical protein HC859_08495 [Bacteroidia bacterium]|nr:hypothetical protein [Bacteroidia bacterium]
MYTKKASLLFWLLSLTAVALAQDITELDKRRGFKDIKLGASIDSVKGAKFKKDLKERDNATAKLYTVEHPDYETIGEIKVDKIEVKTYKDLLYEITVITDKDPRLMKAMENVFGPPQYDAKNVRYYWKTDQIVLSFESKSKHQLQLVYTHLVAYKKMKEDKEKKSRRHC